MSWWERVVLVALAGVGGFVVAALLRSDLLVVDGGFTVLGLVGTVGAVLLLWGVVRNHAWIPEHTRQMRPLAKLLGPARMRAVYGVLGVVILLAALLAARHFNGL
jgi:hypothetical protein